MSEKSLLPWFVAPHVDMSALLNDSSDSETWSEEEKVDQKKDEKRYGKQSRKYRYLVAGWYSKLKFWVIRLLTIPKSFGDVIFPAGRFVKLFVTLHVLFTIVYAKQLNSS